MLIMIHQYYHFPIVVTEVFVYCKIKIYIILLYTICLIFVNMMVRVRSFAVSLDTYNRRPTLLLSSEISLTSIHRLKTSNLLKDFCVYLSFWWKLLLLLFFCTTFLQFVENPLSYVVISNLCHLYKKHFYNILSRISFHYKTLHRGLSLSSPTVWF